jgi:membrane protease YdiL (CAAX protease family)
MTDFPPFLFSVALFIALPLLAWQSRKRLTPDIVIPRMALYGEILFTQTILTVCSLLLAWREKFTVFAFHQGTAGFQPARQAGSLPSPSLASIEVRDVVAAALLLVIALIGLYISSRDESFEDNFVLRLVAPSNRRERLLWIPVCAAAGAGEELAYRALLPYLLESRGIPVAVSVALCSIAFGLAHTLQGWKAAAFTALFGLGFHLLVLYSGNVYGAIAVHFLYDLIAGYLLSRWLDRQGEII